METADYFLPVGDRSVKVSHIITCIIALALKPYCEGEHVKTYRPKAGKPLLRKNFTRIILNPTVTYSVQQLILFLSLALLAKLYILDRAIDNDSIMMRLAIS